MSSYYIELDPATDMVLNIKLIINIKNSQNVKKKLVDGKMECCLIKPSLICDPFQVAVAANKAVTTNALTTKSIYTETLYNLSISKNISQSLKKFGMNEKDSEVLVATIHRKGEVNHMSEITKDIDGEEADIIKLSEICESDAVKKLYKIGDIETEATPLITSVVSRIATKDFISH